MDSRFERNHGVNYTNMLIKNNIIVILHFAVMYSSKGEYNNCIFVAKTCKSMLFFLEGIGKEVCIARCITLCGYFGRRPYIRRKSFVRTS